MIISLSLANWYGGNDFTGNRAVKVTFGASFKRRSGKFAANPSVLDYFRMPVAKERPGSVERGSGPFFFWVAFRLGQNSHLFAGTLSMASIDLA